MAEIKSPLKTKGTPPPALQPSNNLTKKGPEERAFLNFTISPEFKREFKGYAVSHDIPMNKLLEECFHAYRESRE